MLEIICVAEVLAYDSTGRIGIVVQCAVGKTDDVLVNRNELPAGSPLANCSDEVPAGAVLLQPGNDRVSGAVQIPPEPVVDAMVVRPVGQRREFLLAVAVSRRVAELEPDALRGIRVKVSRGRPVVVLVLVEPTVTRPSLSVLTGISCL